MSAFPSQPFDDAGQERPKSNVYRPKLPSAPPLTDVPHSCSQQHASSTPSFRGHYFVIPAFPSLRNIKRQQKQQQQQNDFQVRKISSNNATDNLRSQTSSNARDFTRIKISSHPLLYCPHVSYTTRISNLCRPYSGGTSRRCHIKRLQKN